MSVSKDTGIEENMYSFYAYSTLKKHTVHA